MSWIGNEVGLNCGGYTMKSTNWKDIAELIGTTAIVASLLFLGLQIRQAQDIADSERYQLDLSNLIAINNAINENADIWVRGISGEALDKADAIVFGNLVLNMNDRAVLASEGARRMGFEKAADSIVHDFAAFLFRNPGARSAWEAREKELAKYRKRLMPADVSEIVWPDTIRSDLAKLDEMGH